MNLSHGNPRALEDFLCLPEGALDGEIVRVDFPSALDHGARIPSGNEAGANDAWQPAGKLPAGNSEIVVDIGGMVKGTDYYAVDIEIGTVAHGHP